MKFMRPILLVLFAFLLFGCSSAGPKNAFNEDSTNPERDFKQGNIVLDCELMCTGKYGSERAEMLELYHNELWNRLASKIMSIGESSDQSYFYLGRSADGLGYYKAAKVYYTLAMINPYKCGEFLDVCDGIDIEKEIKERREVIKNAELAETIAINAQEEAPAAELKLAGGSSVKVQESTFEEFEQDSRKYRDRVVSINSDEGGQRFSQLVAVESKVKTLISSGFSPEYLYENNEGDFYLLSPSAEIYYGFYKRENNKFVAEQVSILPERAVELMPLHLRGVMYQRQRVLISEPSIKNVSVNQEGSDYLKVNTFVIKDDSVVVVGYVRSDKVSPSDRENYNNIIYAEVLSDRVVEIEPSVEIKKSKVVTGYRKSPNPEYARAQVAYERAIRQYKKAHGEDLKGTDNATSFLAGALMALREHKAEEKLEMAQLKLANEPMYREIPEYDYVSEEVVRRNLERKVRIRLYRFKGSVKAGEVIITKTLADSIEGDSKHGFRMLQKGLSDKVIQIYLSELNFK